jgi:hypothetical protein
MASEKMPVVLTGCRTSNQPTDESDVVSSIANSINHVKQHF